MRQFSAALLFGLFIIGCESGAKPGPTTTPPSAEQMQMMQNKPLESGAAEEKKEESKTEEKKADAPAEGDKPEEKPAEKPSEEAPK